MIDFARSCFLTVVFILVIFTPPIKLLPYYTWLLALMGIYVLSNIKFRRLIGFGSKRNIGFLKFLIFIFFFNCLLVPISHISSDFSYIPLQIGTLLTLFRSILLMYCLYKFGRGDIFEQYSRYFFIACCIYVSFTLLFIIAPGFKQFWVYEVLRDVEDKSQDFAVYAFRYSIDGFAAFSSASIFSFACLYCSYLVATKPKNTTLLIACLILMIVGCFFYGRISLIGMLLGALLIVWTTGSFKKTVKIAATIIVFVFMALGLLNMFSQSNESLVIWQEWAFSIVKQLFVEKEVTDYSYTHMVNDMYYMPEPLTFLLGDGKYTNIDSTYYGHTDVGFMRLILYGGIVGLSLVYSLIIYLSKNIIKISQSDAFKKFILLATLLFLVLEMKGESYQRAIMMLYPLFLIQQYKVNQIKLYEKE